MQGYVLYTRILILFWEWFYFYFLLKIMYKGYITIVVYFFQIFYSLYGNVLLKHGISLAKL